jgi:plastocyanin
MTRSNRQTFSRSSLALVAVMSNLLGSIFTVSAATTTSAYSEATSTPKVHVVTVGSGGFFQYSPNVTYADPGDIIVWEFFPTGHAVVRGEYTDSKSCGQGGCNPCVPYELIHPGQEGFNSGNINTQSLPTESDVSSVLLLVTSRSLDFARIA